MKLIKLPKLYSDNEVKEILAWFDDLTLQELFDIQRLWLAFGETKKKNRIKSFFKWVFSPGKCDLCDKPMTCTDGVGLNLCDAHANLKPHLDRVGSPDETAK